MSVDGFIALPDDSVGHLFDWYDSGEVALPWPGMGMVSHVTPASAGYLRDTIEETGAIVRGAARLRLHQRLGRRSPARRAALPGHAPAAAVLADPRRALHRRPRRGGRRHRPGQGDRGRQGGRPGRAQHHPAGARPRPGRRDRRGPGAGAPRRRASASSASSRAAPVLLDDPQVIQGARVAHLHLPGPPSDRGLAPRPSGKASSAASRQ